MGVLWRIKKTPNLASGEKKGSKKSYTELRLKILGEFAPQSGRVGWSSEEKSAEGRREGILCREMCEVVVGGSLVLSGHW